MTLNGSDFERFFLRGVSIPTRYFLAPINTGFVTRGEPDERLIRFHSERSGKKIGISYVGNVAIGSAYGANQSTACLDYSSLRWNEISKAIRGQGSIPGIQLACKFPTVDQPAQRWVNRDLASYVEGTRRKLTEIPKAVIESIYTLFGRASRLAVAAGFSVIQIHAAHGYFLSELFSRSLNLRADEFGHGEALTRLVEIVRLECPDAILDIRVSLRDGLESFDISEQEYRASQILQLAAFDVDLISLSAGLYEVDRFLIYPGKAVGEGAYMIEARRLAAEMPNKIWNVAGNVRNIQKFRTEEPLNLTVSIGRPLIADPSFVEKSINKQTSEIRNCIYSGHCHYYTRGKPHISCKANADL
jgi:2,4-dienoyl-CoA reductase-like NADH-dependent reductase (Old Yellow Enzyme family)